MKTSQSRKEMLNCLPHPNMIFKKKVFQEDSFMFIECILSDR